MRSPIIAAMLLLSMIVACWLTSSITIVEARVIHPWGGPPNCTTWKCDDSEGSTIENCSKSYGADSFRFYPNGGICNCPVCMKVLKENEDCTNLTIMDKAVFELCDDGLHCDFPSHRCLKKD